MRFVDFEMSNIKQLIGERIATARRAAGLTIKEVTERIPEFKPARISNWENGHRMPGPNEVLRLAEEFGTSAPFLMGLTDAKEAKSGSSDFFNLVPLYSPDDLAALAKGNAIRANEVVPLDNVHQITSSNKLFAIKVFDSSMTPVFNVGDLIIASITKDPVPGSVVVATIKNENKPILRKFRDVGISGVELIPHNDDWPIIILNSIGETSLTAIVIEHRKYYEY